MNTTTKRPFQAEQEQLAAITKALGNPARIAILQVLMQRNACYCGDIVEELPLAQATVSQHLKVLKGAGLIRGDIDPRRSCYCIDSEGWKKAQKLMADFFGNFSVDTCCP